VLASSNGWSIDAADLVGYLGQYSDSDPGTRDLGLQGLDGIFGAVTYSYVGSGGFADNHGQPHSGADVFVGGENADVFNGMPGPFGPMDPGSDTVDYSRAAAVSGFTGITADLFNPANNTGAAQGDTYISIENLRGSDFNDILTGDGNNNVLEGGLGDDVLDGGVNSFDYGDTVSYEHAAAAVTVSLADSGPQDTGGAGTDTLTNFERLRGSGFDDHLTGHGNSVLEGGAGNDHLTGQEGGTDTASYQHATAGVTVDLNQQGSQQNTDGAGSDTLTDIANLLGSQFNDILTGDGGNNILFGNGGNDTFVFDTSSGIGQDTIGDFISGHDHIALDYAAFDASIPGDFNTWIGSHATAVNNDSDLLINLNGVDTILLKNVALASLQANDFILPSGVA